MAEPDLNLSTADEPRIPVNVEGWPDKLKNNFHDEAMRLNGVTSVRSSGGATGFYVYYDPSHVQAPDLRTELRALAVTIGALLNETPTDALTLQGEALTLNREPITVHDAFSAHITDEAIGEVIRASTWTGIANVRDRVFAVKLAAPMALNAVDALLSDLETSGHNGGPPLEGKDEAIAALKALRDSLDAFLRAVEKSDFSWIDGEGLAASCVHYASRVSDALRDDPVRFASAGLIVALFSVFGLPNAGALLGSIAIAINKKDR